MKLLLCVAVLILLTVAILALADSLGMDVKFPRGFLLLTLLDLAALKGFILIQLVKEMGK